MPTRAHGASAARARAPPPPDDQVTPPPSLATLSQSNRLTLLCVDRACEGVGGSGLGGWSGAVRASEGEVGRRVRGWRGSNRGREGRGRSRAWSVRGRVGGTGGKTGSQTGAEARVEAGGRKRKEGEEGARRTTRPRQPPSTRSRHVPHTQSGGASQTCYSSPHQSTPCTACESGQRCSRERVRHVHRPLFRLAFRYLFQTQTQRAQLWHCRWH